MTQATLTKRAIQGIIPRVTPRVITVHMQNLTKMMTGAKKIEINTNGAVK